MEPIKEAAEVVSTGGKRVKQGNRAVPIILGVVAGALAAGYVGLCAYASSLDTFYPNYQINSVDVSGLTVEKAQEKLERDTPRREIPIYDAASPTYTETEPRDALMTVTLEELGFTPEAVTAGNCAVPFEQWAQAGMDACREQSFFRKGAVYLRSLTGGSGGGCRFGYTLGGDRFEETLDEIVTQLSQDPLDSGYTLGEDSLSITRARDGRTVDADSLRQQLSSAGSMPYSAEENCGADAVFEVLPARTLTAQALYDQLHGEMRNAAYDAATDTILPEQSSAEFDVSAAQAALDAAEPGETVTLSAVIETPEVTAAELEAVLFRDVLGEAQTKVGGTAARKSNVKLSASSINGYVMNSGDVFSYNGVVGQRTAANGYKPAPAYVKGETVDEIGGGICQTSSTLYLACLRGNLEITERYAHRYIPSYIAAGMDATVSWGGPDYKFTNNTSYPIKIVTSYENGYLTVKLLGTNVTGITAKMTNEQLSTTNFEVIYEESADQAPGTQTVKSTAYTGSKWRTYRHLYDADGKLISSAYEATSDYKARNKVILVAPGELPGSKPAVTPDAPAVMPTPEVPAETPAETPAPSTPEPPSAPETTPLDPDETIIVLPELTEEPGGDA